MIPEMAGGARSTAHGASARRLNDPEGGTMFKHKNTLKHTITLVCAVALTLAACSAPPTRSPITPTAPDAETPAATEATEVADTPTPPVLLPEPVLEKSDLCKPLEYAPNMNGVTVFEKPINIAPDPDQPAFAKGLVIVIGIPDDIRQVVDKANANDPTVRLIPVATLTLQPGEQPGESKINLDLNGRIRNVFGAPTNGPSVEIRLHRTAKPVREAVQIVNATASSELKKVIAQPNYMTGRIGGNSWTIGGNPMGIPAGTGQAFWTQWGIKNAIAKDWILNSEQAKDVTVAIFDTSPFDAPGQYRFTNWFIGIDKLGWPEPTPQDIPLVICASDPLAAHFQHDISPTVDFSDHGAFVAGLTHAGAPGAHVDLVRSLFDDAEGDVFSLLANMTAYGLAHQDTLSKTVVNLSLGMRPPTLADGKTYDYDAVGMDVATRQRLADVLDQLLFSRSNTGQIALLSEPPPDAAMALVVTALTEPRSSNPTDHGAKVVAAAGNDAFPNKVVIAQLPARYPNVIGVEGNNFMGNLSCFSNTVQPKIPFDRQAGGDCLRIEITTGKGASKDIWDMVCRPDKDCPYTVTSISVNGRQWMRWRGTSFAAPIVSGMEARNLP